MKIKYILLCFCLIWIGRDNLKGQEMIRLKNPSFEDEPHIGGTLHNRAPKAWFNCGSDGESPPDIQPNLEVNGKPFFGVTTEAHDGNTYMGLVTRDNDTYEAVGQRLENPLRAGKTYVFNLFLARSAEYSSISRSGKSFGTPANYTTPIKIRIYGGDEYCGRKQLLAETELVSNTKWLDYSLVFTPKEDHDYFMLQAFYKTPSLMPYNGNILVDHLSNIVEVVEGTTAQLSSDSKSFREETPILSSHEDEERASFKLSLKGSLSYATPKEIDSIIVDIVEQLSEADVSIPIKIGIMHQGDQFDQQIKNGGLRQLVMNTSKTELGKMIRCLEAMNMKKPLKILKKTGLIYNNKEHKTQDDVEYFEHSDELWLETTAAESISDLRWQFFQLHQKAIIQEIVDLY